MSKRSIGILFAGFLIVIAAGLWALRSTDKTASSRDQQATGIERPSSAVAPTPSSGALPTTNERSASAPSGAPSQSVGQSPASSAIAPQVSTGGRMAPPPRVVLPKGGSNLMGNPMERPWHPGENAIASITTADGTTFTELYPNQVNAFPRVNIQPKDTVGVTVAWPEGELGQTVVAAVEDGGYLGDKQRVLKLTLDERRQMSFTFTCSHESGIFRVTLRKGAETKTVELWAGALPALATAAE